MIYRENSEIHIRYHLGQVTVHSWKTIMNLSNGIETTVVFQSAAT